MTRDEFERLRRRFGDDVSKWPAPYRQQARAMPAGDSAQPAEDDALDRLVLDAATMDGNDDRLAQQVLARVNADRDSASGALLSGLLLRPATMTTCAALLLVALVFGGYRTAASQGEPTDARLLALAAGSPADDGLLDLSGDDGTEDAL